MPAKYLYKNLSVTAFEPRHFDPRDPASLRLAVEHLRTIPDAKAVGLIAELPVRAGQYRLRAQAFLKLKQIEGRKPAEVWQLFDKQIDDQIEYFTKKR